MALQTLQMLHRLGTDLARILSILMHLLMDTQMLYSFKLLRTSRAVIHAVISMYLINMSEPLLKCGKARVTMMTGCACHNSL